MSSNQYHTPKPPTREQWGIIAQLDVNTEKGKIYKGGKEFGHIDIGNGYFKLQIGSRRLKRANIVWWKATGEWPKQMLDHKNTDRTDDRFDNLQYISNSGNAVNTSGGMKSRNGYPKGVSYNPTACGGQNKPFVTWLIRDNKRMYLGRWSSAIAAGKAYELGLFLYQENPSLETSQIRKACQAQIEDK